MKLMGLDVAGWHDVGARDWDPDRPKEVLDPLVIDGGVGTVAIHQEDGTWIGGPQAAIAPHGLGNGWGFLGSEDRRVSIASTYADLIQGNSTRADVYLAAIDALCRHAEQTVLNVSDLPTFDEAARARLISAARGKRRSPRLLWRPVSLFLEALAVGAIERERIGQSFAFLIHSGSGFELQTLRLREDQDHRGHLAPEREGYGRLIGCDYGLSALAAQVDDEIRDANPILGDEPCGRIELGPKLLCGTVDPGSRHVVRHDNGSWIELMAPKVSVATDFERLANEVENALSEREFVSKIFVASPVAPKLMDRILAPLRNWRSDITDLPWSFLARGALRAGRLIERGRPHYFDRLTPVALAVYRNKEPVFHELVDSRATLPANKEFVAPPYNDLKWGARQRDVEFYVVKGGTEVRHWAVHVDVPPAQGVHVELRFRQYPGQSWAKLFLTSSEWDLLQRNPIYLDWETLVPADLTPDEVLEKLRNPPPTIPDRIVEGAHVDLWTGNEMFAGVLSPLREGAGPAVMAKLLSRSMRLPKSPETRLPKSPDRYWTVGTDGAIPDTIGTADVELFDRRMRALADELVQTVRSGGVPPDNQALRVLTWTFTRCPADVQEMIVEALEQDIRNLVHPLTQPRGARTVLIQGGGRCVHGTKLIRRFLDVLVQIRSPNNNTFNALSMVLSRRKEAPQALDRNLVGRIADLLSNEFAAIAAAGTPQAFRVRFKNALSALAGLFRFREVEPYALLKTNDLTAQRIREDLDLIKSAIEARATEIHDSKTKKELVEGVAEFLDGRGQRTILERIDRLGGDGSGEEGGE